MKRQVGNDLSFFSVLANKKKLICERIKISKKSVVVHLTRFLKM